MLLFIIRGLIEPFGYTFEYYTYKSTKELLQKQLVLSYIIVSYILSKELRHFSAKGQFLDRFFGFRRFGHGMLPDSVILRTDTYASANPLIDINDLVFRFDLFRFDLS